MFFQWVVCSAVMCSGIVVQLIRNSKFYPIVILGGVIWETGMCLRKIFLNFKHFSRSVLKENVDVSFQGWMPKNPCLK